MQMYGNVERRDCVNRYCDHETNVAEGRKEVVDMIHNSVAYLP